MQQWSDIDYAKGILTVLSEILGHKNPTVTLNRYAHSLMEHKADMMNRLGKLL